MVATTFSYKSEDNKDIHVYKWAPDDNINIQGVIQIVHGSLEHAKRYEHFAKFLTEQGYVVYANDHRLHGKSETSMENLCCFDLGDFDNTIDDMNKLTNIIHKEYQGKKVIMFGHSMGNILARMFITKFHKELDGVILCGTVGGPAIVSGIMRLLYKVVIRRKGSGHKSEKLHNLSYGYLNKQIKDAKTPSDFISRDRKEIDKYVNDPYCGTLCSVGYLSEIMNGMVYTNSKKAYQATDKDVSILMISGAKDPCGGKNAKEVIKAYTNYKKAGVKDISLKLYEGARHELINELNRDEVFNDILEWLSR